jgi:hypothetical protein
VFCNNSNKGCVDQRSTHLDRSASDLLRLQEELQGARRTASGVIICPPNSVVTECGGTVTISSLIRLLLFYCHSSTEQSGRLCPLRPRPDMSTAGHRGSALPSPSSPVLHSHLKRNPRHWAQRDRFPRPYRTDPDSVVPWSSESPQSLTEASQCADDVTRDRTLWMPRDTTKHALPGSQCRFTPLRVACLGTWRITQKCTQSCTQLQGRRNLTF